MAAAARRMPLGLQAHAVRRMATRAGLDPAQVDTEALLDPTLGLRENLAAVAAAHGLATVAATATKEARFKAEAAEGLAAMRAEHAATVAAATAAEAAALDRGTSRDPLAAPICPRDGQVLEPMPTVGMARGHRWHVCPAAACTVWAVAIDGLAFDPEGSPRARALLGLPSMEAVAAEAAARQEAAAHAARVAATVAAIPAAVAAAWATAEAV